MKEYTIAVKVEVDELYAVLADSPEEALQKFNDDIDVEVIETHQNPIPIDDPQVV